MYNYTTLVPDSLHFLQTFQINFDFGEMSSTKSELPSRYKKIISAFFLKINTSVQIKLC